ncbi:hypothetical protein LNQ52_16010 [Klebsiella pneumoniae subsp. pneumoniae]|nr:hypothetical protein [Klebsiella pneumoniae subsp. pneumoniae]
MADQTNPWGSAPSTDSASQAADAWGGVSTAAPANGGGADWLHSAPAPQPEQFNIMDPFHKTLIPLDSWVTHAIDWIVLHFRPLFQGSACRSTTSSAPSSSCCWGCRRRWRLSSSR